MQITQERQKFLPKEEMKLTFYKNRIFLQSKNLAATLRVDLNTIKEFRDDIERSPDAKMVMKWFQLILFKKPSAELTIEERPTWCASRYLNKDEYHNMMEDAGIAGPSPRNIIVSHPFRTYKFKHFLTWEEWASEKGRGLEFYRKK